jgi:hypothetical protein
MMELILEDVFPVTRSEAIQLVVYMGQIEYGNILDYGDSTEEMVMELCSRFLPSVSGRAQSRRDLCSTDTWQ